MQERFVKVIGEVNKFIDSIAPEEFKDKWNVNVVEGSVSFGSAFHKWALSVSFMKKNGISFKDVIEAYEKDSYKELSKRAPLHKVVLDMVTHHLPNPVTAQRYRVPKIWHGDLDSDLGKSLVNCDPNGPVAFVVTKSIEAKKPSDLPKLIEVLRQKGKEDATLKITINEETGENLISGMGELHLEVIENRIKNDNKLDIQTGPPIVVYRE